MGMLVAVIADAVVKSVAPWMYASLGTRDAAVRARVVRLSYLYFGGITMTAALTALAAPLLLNLVGQDFRGSGDVLAFVALGSAFGGMYLMVVNYIFYARRNEWLSLISLSVGTFNLRSRGGWSDVAALSARRRRSPFLSSSCSLVRGMSGHVAARCRGSKACAGFFFRAGPPAADAPQHLSHLASCLKANRFSSPAARARSARRL